ncbi:aconitate hydratase AcnA [Desulfobacula toluolica]|uniref:Aconitate hydratase n=1 Tax=Desulfobacula toluolica (strain DSM 7467 / Tol2) TaxID=651182 RepID=K0NI94_DESTT|nr:aconitate hydratase AcnA [Desulfobacula toluolica]CCK80670.1 AcnA: aconitate hydratase (aconitase) [Desulfobacula toluolica Tol2]
MTDPSLKQTLILDQETFIVHNLNLLEQMGLATIKTLPFAARVLIENLARNMDANIIQWSDVVNAAKFYESPAQTSELIAFYPARVLMQDFTGVPAVVDFAAMRDAVDAAGADPKKINPLVPVDLVIDHSIQVDHFKEKNSFFLNAQKEYERNKERYQLLKWAQKSFDNFRVVPPESGICHQVNLEYLAPVVSTKQTKDGVLAFPDTLVGTDSHTTMINALGVLGWGVGGIEAEAVMLGQPYYMNLPQIIGVNFIGKPQTRITSTDIALYVTNRLREENVVEKIVEYTGEGLKYLTLTDRATISNMAPEYGATAGFFPVDEHTLNYLKKTNRRKTASLVEGYCKACGFFNNHDNEITFSKKIDVDLSLIETSIAGPSRPQDRISLAGVKEKTTKIFDLGNRQHIQINPENKPHALTNGSIVIAAITSCTNTSNPYTMIGAGLAAKKAVEKGLSIPWHVKTSLSPGSRVVLDYLKSSGLMEYFQDLGFNNTGFGCMTCIGNSGPLDPFIEESIKTNNLDVMSVLSGNRNFEARIHQEVKGNFLMSPILVVIYAIAGKIDIDFESEPLGVSQDGNPVFMKDIWPKADEINHFVETYVHEKFFKDQYSQIFKGDKLWQELKVDESTTFKFDETSSYIRNPPFFKNFSLNLPDLEDIKNARALLVLGDSVTTDHISPAGAIPVDYPAGKYLIDNNIKPWDFNSYGSRRGNHEVMMRGTFANIRIKNKLVSDAGGLTLKFPENEQCYVFDASRKYRDEQTDLLVFGGKEYGTGSSRDWAAKGTTLLGVKAVIAESFERIHRSNLVGMGVLPLIFKEGQSFETLGLSGDEVFEIRNANQIKPNDLLTVNATKNGKNKTFQVVVKLNTDIEIDYIKNGGILHYVLRQMIKA